MLRNDARQSTDILILSFGVNISTTDRDRKKSNNLTRVVVPYLEMLYAMLR